LPTEELMDVDTILNLASFLEYANVYSDQHSGINTVSYGIGTAPGLDDVISYSILPAADSVLVNIAGLVSDQFYYFSLYAINNAQLISDTISSDGFLFINTAGIENSNNDFSFYPNPSSSFIMVNVATDVKLELVNAHGQTVISRNLPKGTTLLDIQELASGYYFLSLGDKHFKLCVSR
jgi:hypothetical protein